MTKTAIRGEKLGKRYRIGERHQYLALRDVLARAAKAPLDVFRKRSGGAAKNGSGHMWALKDASFEVAEGEVVGIVGRNGAGKSTLLKILARVTKPTEGFVKIRGRLGSLLEVGTGFHAELTGRENVFLSGAILGMKKREIERKFDEIVAFSEVEKFIDTPLKHYSSGMQMRLAFAVAAHLEPEVLLVDEVLAVGDAMFQKKCLGKMGEIGRGGRTILFVSHNIAAVHALCSRAILVKGGRIAADGPTREISDLYHAETVSSMSDGPSLQNVHRLGTGKAVFSTIGVEAFSEAGEPLSVAHTGCDLKIQVEIESRTDLPESNVAAIIYDTSGTRLIDTNIGLRGMFLTLKRGERAEVRFHLRDMLLKPGRYVVSLWLGRDGMEEVDYIESATTFDVVEPPEASKHVVVFPGPYACRFESETTVLPAGADESASLLAQEA